jgi:hypothetical protein
MAWTKSENQNLTKDERGWEKGNPRKYTEADENIVLKIHKELESYNDGFFTGASAILQVYRKEYPGIKSPSLRYIGRVLSKHGKVTKQRGRNKGASRYLLYPAHTINNLGERLLEIDFIGKKFIEGRTEPINFIAFSLRNPVLKHFRRVSGDTAENVIKESKRFFREFCKPDVVKVDNAFAMRGSSSGERPISKVMMFFLQNEITPIFTAPRKPWNQASIEGANSVFSRKLWNRFEFRNLKEIDAKLEKFNEAYRKYCEFPDQPLQDKKKRNYIPKIYYIRKVYEEEECKKGYIEVANTKVLLPAEYINLFVLAGWNLKEEELTINLEREKRLLTINKIPFKINPVSKEKLSGFLKKY